MLKRRVRRREYKHAITRSIANIRAVHWPLTASGKTPTATMVAAPAAAVQCMHVRAEADTGVDITTTRHSGSFFGLVGPRRSARSSISRQEILSLQPLERVPEHYGVFKQSVWLHYLPHLNYFGYGKLRVVWLVFELDAVRSRIFVIFDFVRSYNSISLTTNSVTIYRYIS